MFELLIVILQFVCTYMYVKNVEVKYPGLDMAHVFWYMIGTLLLGWFPLLWAFLKVLMYKSITRRY